MDKLISLLFLIQKREKKGGGESLVSLIYPLALAFTMTTKVA